MGDTYGGGWEELGPQAEVGCMWRRRKEAKYSRGQGDEQTILSLPLSSH